MAAASKYFSQFLYLHWVTSVRIHHIPQYWNNSFFKLCYLTSLLETENLNVNLKLKQLAIFGPTNLFSTFGKVPPTHPYFFLIYDIVSFPFYNIYFIIKYLNGVLWKEPPIRWSLSTLSFSALSWLSFRHASWVQRLQLSWKAAAQSAWR